ncbi:MAG: hypothetical protein KBA03_00260 [Anaerolineaceae bacterium]|nr:hypothetical protein [Anaerolineaceae bacterium]
MEKTDQPVKLGEKCPNCGNFNQNGVEICMACGVHLREYKDHFGPQNEKRITQPKTDSGQNPNKHFWLIAIGVVLVLGALVIGGTFLWRKHQDAMKIKAEKTYIAAVDALKTDNFLIAIDNALQAREQGYNPLEIQILLEEIYEERAKEALDNNRADLAFDYSESCLNENYGNNNCFKLKCESILMLSEQKGQQAEYKSAIKLLNDNHGSCNIIPNYDQTVYHLYESWYEAAKREANLFDAWWIYAEWKQNYPEPPG